MNGCIYRTKDGECDLYAESGKYKAFCDMDGCEGRKMSNADRIRQMSDEELAEKIAAQMACMECPLLKMCGLTDIGRCIDVWLSWLKSSVEGGDDNGTT